MFGSSLPSVRCNMVHVLFALFVSVSVKWRSTRVVLCFCFVFLRLVLPVSLDFCLHLRNSLNCLIAVPNKRFFFILNYLRKIVFFHWERRFLRKQNWRLRRSWHFENLAYVIMLIFLHYIIIVSFLYTFMIWSYFDNFRNLDKMAITRWLLSVIILIAIIIIFYIIILPLRSWNKTTQILQTPVHEIKKVL